MAGAWKGVEIIMAASDIVIHKGEKEEKYQLYVEDYVMSYLKNYGAGEGGKIFFYGKREQKKKKYYIYGAGRQRELSCFAQYESLDEIVCRLTLDMPVFLMKNGEEVYELAGYYIFYQSNEAMQNYMVEQRKAAEAMEKSQGRTGAQAGRRQNGTQGIIRPQNIVRPQNINRPQNNNRLQGGGMEAQQGAAKGGRAKLENPSKGNFKGGIMAMQLAAIFVILIAIVINSTNSYTKLEELNQAAVEVFFAMENEEAADKSAASNQAENGEAEQEREASDTEEQRNEASEEHGGETAGTEAERPGEMDGGGITLPKEDTVDAETEGTILRLEDLDGKFEEENQAAKQEEEAGQTETGNKTDGEKEDEQQEEDAQNGSGQEKDGEEGKNAAGQETAQTEEAAPSEQAFARNFAEFYKIEKGDTLNKISIKIYGDTGKVEEICELNKIKDPDNIKYGQKILLP